MAGKKSIEKWEFGDFQTPFLLARKVVEVLKRNHRISPKHKIKQTCCNGSFVFTSAERFQ